MKKELKQKLKPIIKECVQEMLIEEGLLSKIIFEVVKGTQLLNNNSTHTEKRKNIVAENKVKEEQKIIMEEKWKIERERKRKLLDATGFKSNIFEGTRPLSAAPDSEQSESSQAGALSGIEPDDAGVDINGIMALTNRDWRKMI
tara:strand:- start:295 stop:726 length:432 start_codon:yes stop_codon:yes gene_type:complete